MPDWCDRFVPFEEHGAFVIPTGDPAIVLDSFDLPHLYPESMVPPPTVSHRPLEDGAKLVRIKNRKVGWARIGMVLATLRLGMVEDPAEAVLDVPFAYEGEPPGAHPDLGSAMKEIEILRSGDRYLLWGMCRLSGEGQGAVCDRRMFVLEGGRFRVSDSETVSSVPCGDMTAEILYRKGLFVLAIRGPDGVMERPLDRYDRIPFVRSFDGSSCFVDDMEFKIGEGGIAPADWRNRSHRKSRGKSRLYSGDEEHRRLFADISTGGYTVHKAGSLFIATR
ncbi:MAG: hypothetical protein IKQ60_00440 [Candidatus Methanomethylophilaceae archaeon]|nr:hypothetical protein [Candidatus Methanomethylophilaceae archaeon]